MKEIYKDWIKTILILSLFWLIANATLTAFNLVGDGEFFGEKTFLSAYKVSLIIEVIVVSSITLILSSFFWLFKSILKNKK